MNKKLTDIIASCEVSLSAEDSKNIASSLGINDLRKNPTAEQELKFTQVCNLIKQGQTIEQSISSVVEQTKVDHEDSPALSDLDLEAIIIQQANKAADATFSSSKSNWSRLKGSREQGAGSREKKSCLLAF